MPAMETPASFAKLSGVPEKVIRSYIKQGRLPHIITGKSHALVHVEAAMDALKLMAEETAASKAAYMPKPLTRIPIPPKHDRAKRGGRPPDAVRKRNQ